MFNNEQKAIISYLLEHFESSVVKNFIVSVIEVLRNGRNLERCKQSKRFQYKVVGSDGIEYLRPYSTIVECLIREETYEEFKKYVEENYTKVLNTFADLEIIGHIIKYYNRGLKQFQTDTGFLDIRCTKGSITADENTIVVNLRNFACKTTLPVAYDAIPITDEIQSILDDLHDVNNESIKALIINILEYNRCKENGIEFMLSNRFSGVVIKAAMMR